MISPLNSSSPISAHFPPLPLCPGQAQGVLIIAMITLLSRDQQSRYKDLEVCTGGESSDLLPKDYTGGCRYTKHHDVLILCNKKFL